VLLDQKVQDVCIQDPHRQTAYLIPGEELHRFSGKASVDASRDAVTFTLSEDSLLDAVPDSPPVPHSKPGDIIRDCDRDEEFYLTFPQLQQFQVPQPDVHPVAKTFTLPMVETLVEEVPSAVRALLQSGVHDPRLGPPRRS
jgi:hypothetical protein